MKDIKAEYNHHLYSEVQIRFSRIMEMLYWCPGGSQPEPEPKPKPPAPRHAGRPNLAKPEFIVQYLSTRPSYCVVMAWNPDEAGGCPDPIGEDRWCVGVVPATTVYKNGNLEDGVWFSMAVEGGWTIFFDCLADGRLLVINSGKIYRETCKGSNEFVVVGTLARTCDPAFLILSPNKQKAALGIGWSDEQDDCPLLVFPVGILDAESPPLLLDENGNTHPEVIAITINHYSLAWMDNQYIVVDGGLWPGPPFESGISWIDTDADPLAGGPLVTGIPGASGGICFDNCGNLFFGIGHKRTNDSDIPSGNIHYVTKNQVESVLAGGDPMGFSDSHHLYRSLSAGHMLVATDDRLFVGGGRYMEQDETGLGYIECLQLGYPGDGTVSVGSSQHLIIDPCRDDTAEGPICIIKC